MHKVIFSLLVLFFTFAFVSNQRYIEDQPDEIRLVNLNIDGKDYLFLYDANKEKCVIDSQSVLSNTEFNYHNIQFEKRNIKITKENIKKYTDKEIHGIINSNPIK